MTFRRDFRISLAAGLLGCVVAGLVIAQEADVVRPDSGKDPAAGVDEMTLEELEAELAAVVDGLKSESRKTQELRRELWQEKRKAQDKDPDVQALKRKIAELKIEVENAVAKVPAVAAVGEEIADTEAEILYLAQRRKMVADAIAEKKADPAQKTENE